MFFKTDFRLVFLTFFLVSLVGDGLFLLYRMPQNSSHKIGLPTQRSTTACPACGSFLRALFISRWMRRQMNAIVGDGVEGGGGFCTLEPRKNFRAIRGKGRSFHRLFCADGQEGIQPRHPSAPLSKLLSIKSQSCTLPNLCDLYHLGTSSLFAQLKNLFTT